MKNELVFISDADRFRFVQGYILALNDILSTELKSEDIEV